ncbi:GrpB family protein [Rhodomicrobium vannielii ATCC 17100]|uniref:GrpB family protein n=1 Tax=Rhodomicrobium vannielii TaxID=1069 RepID=UPI00191A7546|nr:GrpB family protein [Rhodomicrobium vannielii]MBJ7534414.1 GrpB family protein [Rhodomicrobium vannielii ATCC 17100]
MNNEPTFTLVDAERAREEAQRLFEAVSTSLKAVLPPTADIRHIGATAVPGCLTKGDLDIVVRVASEDFDNADRVLAHRFARNEGSVCTKTFSAFEDSSSLPPLGLQLAAFDSPFDDFHQFVEALLRSPALVQEYNELKRAHDGGDMAVYRSAKDAFIEKVLADFRSHL